mmetsp:Transcript_37749/g.90266  ORF Transcript_37749/g.90266 Transcript_37749/m.90266 type:complete len:240 (-) Transcript_37749:72-791(-)
MIIAAWHKRQISQRCHEVHWDLRFDDAKQAVQHQLIKPTELVQSIVQNLLAVKIELEVLHLFGHQFCSPNPFHIFRTDLPREGKVERAILALAKDIPIGRHSRRPVHQFILGHDLKAANPYFRDAKSRILPMFSGCSVTAKLKFKGICICPMEAHLGLQGFDLQLLTKDINIPVSLLVACADHLAKEVAVRGICCAHEVKIVLPEASDAIQVDWLWVLLITPDRVTGVDPGSGHTAQDK